MGNRCIYYMWPESSGDSEEPLEHLLTPSNIKEMLMVLSMENSDNLLKTQSFLCHDVPWCWKDVFSGILGEWHREAHDLLPIQISVHGNRLHDHMLCKWASTLSRNTEGFYFWVFTLLYALILHPTLSFNYRAQQYHLHQTPHYFVCWGIKLRSFGISTRPT